MCIVFGGSVNIFNVGGIDFLFVRFDGLDGEIMLLEGVIN